MNNEIKQLNEYLAENMFGEVRGKDFSYIKETECGCEYCTEDGYSVGTNENGEPNCTYSSYKIDAPDYTKNYQIVLENLSRLCFEIKIEVLKSGMAEITAKYHFGTINVIGNNLGEAICLAAVEYFERSKKDE